MLEDHSPGLLAATFGSLLVFVFGLVVNLSHLTQQYSSSAIIPDILPVEDLESSNETSSRQLRVSLADWSTTIWAVVYICQSFWLAFSLANICRRTALGPAYNNPKLIPLQVHLFFCLSVLTQVGWLVLMDRHHLTLALLLVVIATCCCGIALAESYRSLLAVHPILLQDERMLDVWAVRVLVQNSLAFFFTWMTLHATLTLAYFLTFAIETHHVTPRSGSLVQLYVAGFFMFAYTLSDLTVLDIYSRYAVSPYVAFVLFHAGQLDKDWPSTRTHVFVLLAALTAFTFLCVLVKVTALLCRHLLQAESEVKAKVVVTARPLAPDLEEETYLLDRR